jgi:hypothetical protein
MPSKSASPEAAHHQKAASKVVKDFNAEERRLSKEVVKADKAAGNAYSKLNKFRRARTAKQNRAVSAIESRIAILRGRLGL